MNSRLHIVKISWKRNLWEIAVHSFLIKSHLSRIRMVFLRISSNYRIQILLKEVILSSLCRMFFPTLSWFRNVYKISSCCWFCIHFWIKWELGKIFDTNDLSFASTETKFKNPITKTQNNIVIFGFFHKKMILSFWLFLK